MTASGSTLARAPRSLRGTSPVVASAIAAVVALRLPLVARPATPDEGGFLVVASQWHAGGSSLYGDYWVDRPPLLVAIFQLADLAGGLVALRLVGALMAAATVALLASTAGRSFGASAAGWTAVVAAALLVSPLFGAEAVNGELLAAPFLALGIRLAVEAVPVASVDAPRSTPLAALGAGAAAMLALLVKQNIADAMVFACVCWVVAWRLHRIPGRVLARLLAMATAGAALAYVAVLSWAVSRGTTPWGVYEATYPFRIDAGRVLLEAAGRLTQLRLGSLGLAALGSGAVLVMVGFVVVVARRRSRDPITWAVLATACFSTLSILLGGSYWLHYLVQAVPAVALAAGALSVMMGSRAVRLTRTAASFVVVSALVALGTVVALPEPAPGAAIGETLAMAAQPGDTVLSAFGDPNILHTAQMPSPYPYLWSLPSRTLDPDLDHLRRVLAGPAAPSWLVVRSGAVLRRLTASGVRAVIENRYRLVGEVCGRSIYLQRGMHRPELVLAGRCGGLVVR